MKSLVCLLAFIFVGQFVIQGCEKECDCATSGDEDNLMAPRITFPMSGDSLWMDTTYNFVVSIPSNLAPKGVYVFNFDNHQFGGRTYDPSLGHEVEVPTLVPSNWSNTQYLHPKLILTNDSAINGEQIVVYYKE